MDRFPGAGKDGHKPPRKIQRSASYDEGFLPTNAVICHHGFDGSIPLTMGSGDRDVKTSGDAVRWNDEVRAIDNCMHG